MTDAAAQTADWPANPFWDFSIAVYRRPGVGDACLALQEKRGIDVNLLLYFAWLGIAQGQRLGSDEIASVVIHAAAWHDGVVRPLRVLRTAMKGGAKGAPPALAERLRGQIKSAELNAERIEQQMLYAMRSQVSRSARGSLEGARANIGGYFTALKIQADSADWSAVDAILSMTDT